MNAAKQAFFMFLSLIILACSGWYFAADEKAFKLDAETLLTTTDTVMTNVRLKRFSESGQLANSLTTPLMRHIPKNNTHWIKDPQITILQDGQGEWTINSHEATALYGGKKITFKDKVHIHQQKSLHNEESTFTTEAITYYPMTKHAITSKDVLFEQTGNRVQAKGMKADLETKHIQLLSRARGLYEPNHG